MVWRFTKNNIFTLRSAYHAEWDHQFGRWFERTEGQPLQQYPVWQNCGNPHCRVKSRYMHGKCCMDSYVPCYGILANRHIAMTTNCPVCAGGCGDIKHVLFTYPRVSGIWRCLKLDGLVEEASEVDRAGSSVLDYILCAPPRGSLLPDVSAQTLILVGVWYVWWERRQKVHGEEVQTPARSALSISALATNYTNARKKEMGVKKGG